MAQYHSMHSMPAQFSLHRCLRALQGQCNGTCCARIVFDILQESLQGHRSGRWQAVSSQNPTTIYCIADSGASPMKLNPGDSCLLSGPVHRVNRLAPIAALFMPVSSCRFTPCRRQLHHSARRSHWTPGRPERHPVRATHRRRWCSARFTGAAGSCGADACAATDISRHAS